MSQRDKLETAAIYSVDNSHAKGIEIKEESTLRLRHFVMIARCIAWFVSTSFPLSFIIGNQHSEHKEKIVKTTKLAGSKWQVDGKDYTEYKVLNSDSDGLGMIAQRHGFKGYQGFLRLRNGTATAIGNANQIAVGESLLLPVKDSPLPVCPQQQHTVKANENLTNIAKKYSTTVEKIVSDNRAKYPGITKDHIGEGWKLAV